MILNLFFLLSFMVYVYFLIFVPHWEHSIECAESWESLANSGEKNTEEYYSDISGYDYRVDQLRMSFIIEWNNDINRWRGYSSEYYNKVPKWYLKLRNKKLK